MRFAIFAKKSFGPFVSRGFNAILVDKQTSIA
jgi:hypothetical protein